MLEARFSFCFKYSFHWECSAQPALGLPLSLVVIGGITFPAIVGMLWEGVRGVASLTPSKGMPHWPHCH